MAKYSLGVNHARQRSFLYRSRKFIFLLIVILILIGLGLYIDSRFQLRKANTASQSTAPETLTIAPSTQVFTTPYFQFQTNKEWNFIANESSNSKFVYRRGTANLVSGDISVYINSSPQEVQATRVLPVVLNVDEPFVLKASFVSDHCKDKLSKEMQQNTSELTLTLNSVRFLCDVDGNSFTVIVGLENATPVMNFARPDGSNANYMIYIRDLRFKADPDEFEDIMNSFQIR